jgi:hypothetical protein
VSALVAAGCAYKVAPSGGPQDSIPAAIIGVDPPSGSTNVTSNEIHIQFDDYVDRGIRNSITVLPTKRFSTSYAGDEIAIGFREPLDSSTTYSITIGTDWTDTRGNRPLEAYTYVFSTGPMIDSGTIGGRISAATLQNVIVMCYPRADTLTAAFTPLLTKAPYIIPVGTSGVFTVKGLATGRYRVVACRDDNKNSMLDMNEDFATASSDIDVSTAQSAPLLLRLGKARDHEPPQIARVRGNTSTLASIQFTEPVLPFSTWDSVITLASPDGRLIRPAAIWPSPTAPDVVLIRFSIPLDSATYTLQIAPHSIRDSAGTMNADTADSKKIQWTTRQDTTRLRIVQIAPRDSARDVSADTVLRVTFSDAVDTSDVRISLWHEQPQGAVPVRTQWISPAELEIRALQPRLPKTWYRTTIVADRLTSFLGSSAPTDTVRHAMLTSTRMSEPGTVKGRLDGVVQPPTGMKCIMRLLSTQGAVVHTAIVDSSGMFIIANAPPGEYTADVFHDRNGNGQFDHGDWRPFSFSEPWWPVRKKVVVRSRWTLEDVLLEVTLR